jgi:general secretion pathway protein H
VSRSNAGFTLLELIVCIAILGLVAVIVVPQRIGGSAIELKAGARALAVGLRAARGEAVARNHDTAFAIDVERRVFAVGGGAGEQPLPEKANITLVTATNEVSRDRTGNIRFFPDGSSTGGGIRLELDGLTFNVTVDWLTGQVAVQHAR